MGERAHLIGKLAALALAVGAVSLAVGAVRRWKRDEKKAQSEPLEAKEATKKRPHSAAASPEQAKRLRQAEYSLSLPHEGQDVSGVEEGSIRDQKALLAAKIAVPDSDQSPEKLGQHYEKMAAKFEAGGLDLSAVRDAGKFYSISNGQAEPLAYATFETPLARGAVRLGVFRVTDAADKLATEAHNAAQSILQTLPPGWLVHENQKQHYHLTIQMISHPSDPRPDAFVAGGGIDRQRLPSPIPAPTQAAMKRERGFYKATAAAGHSPILTVHSVVLADSGALLLLFTDSKGLVHALRKRLRQALPGCAEKQPSILHATLARVLTPQQLGDGERQEIVRACRRWTDRLRGRRLVPRSLWHVQENTFTFVNVDHSSLECPFMSVE